MSNVNARALIRSAAVSAGVAIAAPFLWGAVPAVADTVEHDTAPQPMSAESEQLIADALHDAVDA